MSNLTVDAKRAQRIREFWLFALPHLGKAIPRWAGQSGSGGNWLRISSSVKHASYTVWVRKGDIGCGLYLDAGSGKRDWNKAVFDALLARRAEIEKAFGSQLVWDRLDKGRCSTIDHFAAKVGYAAPRAEWPTITEMLVGKASRFETTFDPYLTLVTKATRQ